MVCNKTLAKPQMQIERGASEERVQFMLGHGRAFSREPGIVKEENLVVRGCRRIDSDTVDKSAVLTELCQVFQRLEERVIIESNIRR